MKSENQFHLNEEQISRVVVDEADLAREHRLHLSECQICRKQVDQFRQELFTLGKYAGLSVPPFRKTISLPSEESAPSGHNSRWLPSFAAAVMAGLVLFVYFLSVETTPPNITKVVGLEEQSLEVTLEDEDLMDEIFELVEYPLPDVMYEMTGNNGVNFDEFLQNVVPDDQDDFQS